MRIGIDGRELLDKPTGVGRYLLELCDAWCQSVRSHHHEFILYTPDNKPFALFGKAPHFIQKEQVRNRSVPGTGSSWWEQTALRKAVIGDNVDVFFAPAYSAPLRLAIPTVLTIHDVSFLAHPEWFGWKEGLRRRWLADRSINQAEAVISVSQFTRAEILRFYNISPHRVHVVLSGLTSLPPTPTDNDGTPRILFVGSIFNRRHLPVLLRAFAKVRRSFPKAQLTIVGDNRTYPKQDLAASIVSNNLESAISLRAYVSDVQLAQLYRQASVFVFLSEYEGFGLTPFEAMSAGVPVVAADTPVARELYEDAALFVPIANVNATADAIHILLTDAAVRERQCQLATTLLKNFSWKDAASKTLQVLELAATRKSE